MPFLLWNFIGFVIWAAKSVITKPGFSLTFKDFLACFWSMPSNPGFPVDYPLWFIRDLILISFFLTPVIYIILKRLKWGVIALIISYLLFRKTQLFGLELNVNAIFWFSMVAWFSIRHKNMVSWCMKPFKWLWPISIALALISCYFVNEYTIAGTYFHRIFLICGVITLLGFTGVIVKRYSPNVNSHLKQSGFFIFALHGIMPLSISAVAMAFIFNENTILFGFLKYFLTSTLAVVLCLASQYILFKISPKTLKILTGR